MRIIFLMLALTWSSASYSNKPHKIPLKCFYDDVDLKELAEAVEEELDASLHHEDNNPYYIATEEHSSYTYKGLIDAYQDRFIEHACGILCNGSQQCAFIASCADYFFFEGAPVCTGVWVIASPEFLEYCNCQR